VKPNVLGVSERSIVDEHLNWTEHIQNQKQREMEAVKQDLLKKMTDLDLKEVRRLWAAHESYYNPKAVTKKLIESSLAYLKVSLLEEVSTRKYEAIMNAVQKGQPLSEHSRPGPLQLVIATTWRSGSTFLEELLASHPAVYNHYEPLMQFDLHQVRDGGDALKAQKLVHDLLSCSYNSESEYMKKAKEIRDMFQRNTRIWKVCKTEEWGEGLCYNDSFLKQACKLFPWSTMKLVRLRLNLLEPVLQDASLNVKVIYLVRDPRGVMNSRSATVQWCKTADCNDPALLCQDMDSDLTAAIKLKNKYPQQIYILRYEDLALNPINKTHELLDYLKFELDSNIEEFLKSHTTTNYDKPWSTKRESSTRVTYWSTKLSAPRLKEIQDSCVAVMKKFGYLTVNSTKEVTSVNKILAPVNLMEYTVT
ncbi:unnamed protein product, partial [Meganyctiphanes norvegica]